MSKKKHKHRDESSETVAAAVGAASGASASGAGSATATVSREYYEAQLHMLQVELVKLQRHFIGCGDKTLVLVEGRDAADILSRLPYAGNKAKLVQPDPDLSFEFTPDCIAAKRLAR